MRIGIDATGLGGPKTGTAVYVAEILSAWSQDKTLKHEFVVFATDKARAHLVGLGLDERFTWVRAPDHRHWRVLWQQLVLPWRLAQHRVDVHWGTGFVLPVLARCPMVLTVHDLTFQLFPQLHERIKRYYFPAIIRASVGKAKAVLAISRSTQADLHRLLPASAGKTHVTLLAGRPLKGDQASRAAHGHDGPEYPYLLFVGTVEPRKNLERLVQAWQEVPPAIRGQTRLVVIGATGWLVDEWMARLNTTDAVDFKGSVTDKELGHWMAGALAFLYPSLYEGFGLPVVEAMAQGLPVLTSDVGATKEVAGDAALLVEPGSVDSIRAGLVQLLTDGSLRASLAEKGRQRAAAFSWAHTARQTMDVLQAVARPPNGSLMPGAHR